MNRRESTYVKSLVLVALAAVLTASAYPRPWSAMVFPAAGVLFAAGGAAAAARLDAAGSARAYLRRAAPALLLPFWAFGAAVVTVMALGGWESDPMAGSAPLDWRTGWLWLLPLADPPVSTDGLGMVGPLWFVRVFLWLALLTPPLVWLVRRWPLRLMAVPLVCMGLVTVGIANPLGTTADILLGLCAYAGCWLLGAAHHDGRLRAVPAGVALAGGAVLTAAGIGLALWQQELHGTYALEANPAAAMLFSLGGVLVLLRLDPWLGALDRVRGVRPVLSLFHGRTLTAFLWADPLILLTPPALALTPLARFHTATPRGVLLEYAATWVLLLGAVVLLGWLEDLGAGRRPGLLPRRRRRAAAAPALPAPDVPAPVAPQPRPGGFRLHGNVAAAIDGTARRPSPGPQGSVLVPGQRGGG
ncbi:Acyltransferase family protein [Geodermatophilus pulveris]|uniref:Acyltransferase family protein n=1 Tax=Geodermatophilus pulveris TaxID=1564159 RepID=A0A239JMM7_9ACTN|nr:acyltransferase family protein [Geodermatophilus pulveris]SNT06802.1 Acyltransferase family protein [Geodermatophilus pulveris]